MHFIVGIELEVTKEGWLKALIELLLEIYPRNTDSRTTLKYTKYQLLYILIRTTVDINFAFALFIKE